MKEKLEEVPAQKTKSHIQCDGGIVSRCNNNATYFVSYYDYDYNTHEEVFEQKYFCWIHMVKAVRINEYRINIVRRL